MNLLRGAARTNVLARISQGAYHVVLASPPCSTFSRARRRDDSGPKPLRSERFPRGFPWLGPQARKTVNDANKLIDFTAKALALQAPQGGILLESPEDLGRAKITAQQVFGVGLASAAC